MRLIDEDAVMERFNKLYGSEYSASELLDSIPTAYDIDMVVGQLEERKCAVHKSIILNPQSYYIDRELEVNDMFYDGVIKLVKDGGIS